jgi:hypothetical protein
MNKALIRETMPATKEIKFCTGPDLPTRVSSIFFLLLNSIKSISHLCNASHNSEIRAFIYLWGKIVIVM